MLQMRNFLISNILFSILFSLAAENLARAAAITKLVPEKFGAFIDDGPEAGFVKGATVCIYDSSDTEIACGKVTGSKDKRSAAKFKDAETIGKLEIGMTAKIKVGGEAPVATAIKTTKKALTKKTTARKYLRNFDMRWLPGIPPSAFKRTTYTGPTAATGDITFADNATPALNLLGFGGQLELRMGQSSSFALGGRYRIFNEFIASSDYGFGKGSDEYVDVSESGKAIGFWTDFYFVNAELTKTFIFKLGAGLDFDMLTVGAKVTHKNDAGNIESEILSYSSAATTVSLRIPLVMAAYFNPVGLNFGLNLLVPLTEVGKKETVTNSDPATPADAERFKAGIAHKKNSFGAEILLGAFFAF